MASEAGVEAVVRGLVREFLVRKGLNEALRAFDVEAVRYEVLLGAQELYVLMTSDADSRRARTCPVQQTLPDACISHRSSKEIASEVR